MRLRNVHILRVMLLAGIALTWIVTTGMLDARPLTEEVADRILQRTVNGSGKSLLNFAYNDQDTVRLLQAFYTDRKGLPAWSGNEGPNEQAADLLRILKRATREGLSPQDYGVARIEALIATINLDREGSQPLNVEQLADLDLLLTEAFFSYTSHFSGGRADHQRHYPGWVFKRRQTDLIKTLTSALESREMEATLNEVAPRFYGYMKLRERLNEYIDIAEAGGWRKIPAGRPLMKGMRDKRVRTLRKRLISTGMASLSQAKTDTYFDLDLETAVRRFQRQHGLREDGIVGRTTLVELNVPVEVRICQMAVNLDRLRWLPYELGDRHILINIPDFNLEIVEDKRVVMHIRAIVGKTDKRTNLLSSRITAIELNPYWKIPKSIAVEEFLPQLKRNPRYLGKKIKVFAGDYQTNPVSPTSIKWSRVTAENFPYFLRQEPGSDNPLGRVKFVFSNEADIYIHDTPTRNLFTQDKRSFSHGCVRIEKPVDLAAYLLKIQPNNRWSSQNIQAEIRKGKNLPLPLNERVPVHIVYQTVWIDREGNLNFRPDIYDIDNIPANLLMVLASLKQSPGASSPQ